MNSDNLGNTLSYSRGFMGDSFLLCFRLNITDFMYASLFIWATTITTIYSSNSVLFTIEVGGLDSAWIACCFTPAVCTILKSCSNKLSRQRASFAAASDGF